MEEIAKDRMIQLKLTIDDWDNVKKIKDHIKIAKTTITQGVIWEKVDNIKLDSLECFGEHKVYVISCKLIDCDVNNGAEESWVDKIYKYIIIEGKVRSLEGYKYEIEMQIKQRKRRTWLQKK